MKRLFKITILIGIIIAAIAPVVWAGPSGIDPDNTLGIVLRTCFQVVFAVAGIAVGIKANKTEDSKEKKLYIVLMIVYFLLILAILAMYPINNVIICVE